MDLQDTVVALHALAEYAAATDRRSTNLNVAIKESASSGASTLKGFTITNEDKNREFVYPLVSIADSVLKYSNLVL